MNFHMPQSELKESNINSWFSIIRFKTILTTQNVKKGGRGSLLNCLCPNWWSENSSLIVDMALLKRHLVITDKSNGETRSLILNFVKFNFHFVFVFLTKTFCPNCRTRFINVKYNSDSISQFFPWPHSSTKQTQDWWTLKKISSPSSYRLSYLILSSVSKQFFHVLLRLDFADSKIFWREKTSERKKIREMHKSKMEIPFDRWHKFKKLKDIWNQEVKRTPKSPNNTHFKILWKYFILFHFCNLHNFFRNKFCVPKKFLNYEFNCYKWKPKVSDMFLEYNVSFSQTL